MINYYFFTVAFVLGCLLLVYGIKKHLKYTRSKEVSSFKVSEAPHGIHLNAGKYSIDILGGGQVNNLPFRIINESDQQKVDIYKFGLPYRRFKNGIMAVTCFHFEVKEAGNYLFVIKDLNKISVKQFAPKLLSGLTSQIHPLSLSLIVKDYASPLTYGLSILMINCGIGLIGAGIIGCLYLMRIIQPGN